MNEPPPTLDGARVLWWAWSGEEPFGEMPGAEGEDRYIFAFAVCRYDDPGATYYRFSCNRHWKVVNDDEHSSEEEAKDAIPSQYDASRVTWRRFAIAK